MLLCCRAPAAGLQLQQLLGARQQRQPARGAALGRRCARSRIAVGLQRQRCSPAAAAAAAGLSCRSYKELALVQEEGSAGGCLQQLLQLLLLLAQPAGAVQRQVGKVWRLVASGS